MGVPETHKTAGIRRTRTIPALFLLAGILRLGTGLLTPYFLQHSAIGLPGGAQAKAGWDTAGSLFSDRHGVFGFLALFGAALLAGSLLALLLHKAVAAGCSVKTTSVAMGLSALGASGAYSALGACIILGWGATAQYPRTYPGYMLVGMLSLLGFVLLLALYAWLRRKRPSVPGILFDIFSALLFFIPFLSGCAVLESLLRAVFSRPAH